MIFFFQIARIHGNLSPTGLQPSPFLTPRREKRRRDRSRPFRGPRGPPGAPGAVPQVLGPSRRYWPRPAPRPRRGLAATPSFPLQEPGLREDGGGGSGGVTSVRTQPRPATRRRSPQPPCGGPARGGALCRAAPLRSSRYRPRAPAARPGSRCAPLPLRRQTARPDPSGPRAARSAPGCGPTPE